MLLVGALANGLLWTLMAARIAIVSSAPVAQGQPALRYADRDADRVATVLRELGGFEDVWVLKDVGPTSLRGALDKAERRAQTEATELFIYYSGHADHAGLLLGDDRFSYAELRQRLQQSSASVRVAMVDACHAGQVVSTKGAHAAPAFDLTTPDLPGVKGAAILAASTASEVAQESSDLEGSYFTHHVLSALRGAGDSDGNGMVTLQEAYEYAYGRTVASTMPNFFGSQHPTFEYNLSGTGNLVLTRLSRGGAVVVVGPGIRRNYLLTSTKQGVVSEVWSDASKPLRLSVAGGAYRVWRRDGESTYIADVQIRNGGEVHVAALPFRKADAGLALAKGSSSQRTHELAVNYGIIAFGPGELGPVGDFGLGYARRKLRWSWGAHLNYGASRHSLPRSDLGSGDSMAPSNTAYQFDRLSLSGQLLRRMPLGFSEISVGAKLGVMAVSQRFGDEDRWAAGPLGFGTFAADVPFASWLSLRLSWNAGAILMKVGTSYRLRPEIQSSIGLIMFFR